MVKFFILFIYFLNISTVEGGVNKSVGKTLNETKCSSSKGSRRGHSLKLWSRSETFELDYCSPLRVCQHPVEGLNIRELFTEIPAEDLSSLDSLFSELLRDHFGYTLFGDKPISLSSHFVITPWENIVERTNNLDGIFWKNWNIWEKYQDLFPMKNYLLIKEKSRNKNIKHIILINKNEFINVVNQNQRLFEAILGRKISPKDILDTIEAGNATLMDIINDNQALWGILLGYGKHNSMLYNQRERNYFNCLALSDIALKHSSITLEGVGDYKYSPLIMGSVYFAGDMHHPETITLQRKYQELREKISLIYSQGDLLEISLSQLTR